MTDQDIKGDVKTPEVAEPEKQVAVDSKTENNIPQSRFNEVVGERNELRDRISKLEAGQKEAREKELEKQGEYKTLLEESKVRMAELEIKANQLDTYESQRRESIYSKLSDDQKKVADNIPSLSGLEVYAEQTISQTITNTAEPGRGHSGDVDRNEFRKRDLKDQRKNWGDYLNSFKN